MPALVRELPSQAQTASIRHQYVVQYRFHTATTVQTVSLAYDTLDEALAERDSLAAHPSGTDFQIWHRVTEVRCTELQWAR